MTDANRPVCDCPEPCGCYAEGYAAGKDKAYFEVEMALRTTPTPPVAAVGPAGSSESCWRRRCWPAARRRWRTMATGTEAAHVRTISRETPALLMTLLEGTPTTSADVDLLADARARAGRPTPGAPMSPAGRTSPAGASNTDGRPASGQRRPLHRATWWRPRQDTGHRPAAPSGDRRGPPPGRTREPNHSAAGQGDHETSGQGARQAPRTHIQLFWTLL